MFFCDHFICSVVSERDEQRRLHDIEMSEKGFKNEMSDEALTEMLGSLPRIEAPTNFDARVRSRIAQGTPSSGRAWLIPSAAAVSLGSIVLAAVAFVYLRGPEENIADMSQPVSVPVATQESPNPQFAEPRIIEPQRVMQPVVANSKAPLPVMVAERSGEAVTRRRNTTNKGGGSLDWAVRPTEDPKVARGMPTPGATPESMPRQMGPVVKVSAREVLQLLGLDADFRDGGWLVKKVAATSLAGRSGVRDGDIVESIDDVKVIGSTTFENGFNGKNLTILRKGSRQTISLQNQ